MNLVYKILPFMILLCGVQQAYAQTNFIIKNDSLIVTDLEVGQVTELNLNNLGLQELPINISTYSNLKSLSLQNNQLISLDGLGELLKLEELDLSKNPLLIGRIASKEISQLKSLKYLDVSECNWSYISINLLKLSKLQHLDLSKNKLTILPVEIKNLTHLTWLDLSQNELQLISPGLKNLQKLKYLNLSENSIQNTNLMLQQLAVTQQLSHLVMDGISVENLPEVRLNQVQRLEVRNMDYKNSTWMVTVFSNLESLEIEIDHNENEIEFYSALTELQYLKTLKVYDDEMTFVPLELGKIKGLQSLSVSGFRITSFAEGAFRFTSLTEFELCNSSVINQESLYNDLRQAANLEKVGLKSNGIQEIDPNIAKLQQVKKIDFSRNEITRLPSTLARLNSLDLLNVSGNEVVVEDVQELKRINPQLDIQYDQTVKKIDLVVKPPMEDINVPFENFNVSAESGQIINATTGSRIKIPAKAFLYADGSVVTGRVDVQYREFNDPLDMALAGIPMTFEEDGVQKYFSSAGMLQFDATQNGEQLFANPEAPVQVDLVSSNPDPEMDLFYLDAEEQSWVNIGKDSISPAIDSVSNEETIAEEDLIPRPSYPVFPYQKEGVNIRMKSDKKNAIYELTFAQAHSWGNTAKKEDVQRYTEFEVLNKGKWIVDGSKKERKIYAARIDSIQEQIRLYNIATRGRASLSEIKTPDSTSNGLEINFTSSNKLLEDIWVEPNEKGDNFNLCIDLSGKMVKVPVIPKRSYGSAASAQKRMNRIYTPYYVELKQRRVDWKEIELKAANYFETYEKLMDEYNQQMEVFNAQTIRLNTVEMNRINQQTASYSNVTRSLSLGGFGFYNCDRIIIIQNQKRLIAQLKSEKDKPISSTSYMVLDNTANTVFSYSARGEVRYNQRSVNDLLVFMRGNKVGVYSGKHQGAFVSKKNEPMYLATYDLNKMSLAEFKQQAGFEW